MRKLAAVALAALAVAGAAYAVRSLTRPDPLTQATADGCKRSDFGLFTRQAPNWAYVNDRDFPADGPAPPPQWASGVVDAQSSANAVHPSGGDVPFSHDAFDLNFDVAPDPQYAALLGGDPDAKTGNFSPGEQSDRLHVERELSAVPTFAWPEAGDRVSVLGSWIWDCDHSEEGERTELHPFRALWVRRAVPSPRSARGEAEGDVFVSTDPTAAGKIEDCAHRAKGNGDALVQCDLASAKDRGWQDVSGGYRFTLPLPARPAPRARLVVRVVERGSTAGAPRFSIARGARAVTVSFTLKTEPGQRLVLARQVFAGWTPLQARPTHLRLTFTKVLVRRAMDPGCASGIPNCSSPESTRNGQISDAPGEWQFASDVAGSWRLWPGTLRVRDGQTVPLRVHEDVYVYPSTRWRVLIYPRECDTGTVTFSNPNGVMAPCPRLPQEFGNRAGDDVPGTIVDSYRGIRGALGVHARNGGLAYPSTCPPVNKRGCYRLTYRVDVVRKG